MTFSEGVERALEAAVLAHDGQLRKGTSPAPYIVHPVHVALMLARWGCDDAVLQAALLHDVVEDCDGWTVERVREEFGARVAQTVAELSEDKTLAWEERKRLAVEHVSGLSADAVIVKAGDQLHNLRSLLLQLRSSPDEASVWRRFKGGRERTLVMAERLASALAKRVDAQIGSALRRAYDDLAAHVSGG